MRLLSFALFILSAFCGCRDTRDFSASKSLATAPGGAEEVISDEIANSPHVQSLAYLIDWERLDAITRKRGATPSLRKACYRLEIAKRAGIAIGDLIEGSHRRNGVTGTERARAVTISLEQNHMILSMMGCFDDTGLAKLEDGKAPTITLGDQTGEMATVDHVLPRSVVPELDNRLYNLRFLAESLNQAKGASISPDNLALAESWYRIGLLSEVGFEAAKTEADSSLDSPLGS